MILFYLAYPYLGLKRFLTHVKSNSLASTPVCTVIHSRAVFRCVGPWVCLLVEGQRLVLE